MAATDVEVTGDECYYENGEYVCYQTYGDGGVGYSVRSQLQTDADTGSGSTNSYCVPIKVCGTEDYVKMKCEELTGCVAFTYGGGCGALKSNATEIRSPSDNGETKVWYLEG